MSDVEIRYFKALGAIEQRIVFYAEQSVSILEKEGEGCVQGLYLSHKVIALQEALNLLEGQE